MSKQSYGNVNRKHKGPENSSFKRGRKELRNLNRKPKHASQTPLETSGTTSDDTARYEPTETDDFDEKHRSKTALHEDKAYNALLTLLKEDERSIKKRKVRSSTKNEGADNASRGSNEETIPRAKSSPSMDGDQPDNESRDAVTSSDEEEEDEIAGVNLGEDEDHVSDNENHDVDYDLSGDEDEGADSRDPFELHFNDIDEAYLNKKQKELEERSKWETDKIEFSPSFGYLATRSYLPDSRTNTTLQDPFVHLKSKVKSSYIDNFGTQLTGQDKAIFQHMSKYEDILFPYKDYNNDSYRKLYITHALNHVYKTRDRILKNNNKLHNYQSALKEGKTNLKEPEFKDQGFTRPKVLILLPSRNSCYEVVNLLIKLSGTDQHENKRKFNDQFYSNDDPPDTKPEDFRRLFKGNNNDFFCIGLKLTRKSLKLYSSFYSSDIIIASPIGLSLILESPDKRKRQYDFISSIEVLVIDQAHHTEMQNWSHVNTVLKYINKIPKDFHDADFSRIRMWSINDQAKLLRQNLVFTEYSTPTINSIIGTKSSNIEGKVRFKPNITSKSCVMSSIGLKVRQTFQRFDCDSPANDPDARFKFFTNTILPSMMRTTSYEDGFLIFIPSYFDYLRVKDYMKNNSKLLFGSIDEYSSQSKLTKTRQNFASRRTKILLYTERLHHFRRFEIAGVKNVLMYGVPSNPIFYKELVRFIGVSIFKEEADLNLSFVKTLYSKWDAVSLERIVGKERAPVLCNAVNSTYEFK